MKHFWTYAGESGTTLSKMSQRKGMYLTTKATFGFKWDKLSKLTVSLDRNVPYHQNTLGFIRKYLGTLTVS